MVSAAYGAQGKVFLAQAWEELGKGDLRQASEKGWGAASQMVKAAAELRMWNHQKATGDLHDVVRLLAREVGDRSLRQLFNTAGSLHQNFYEGWQRAESVRRQSGGCSHICGADGAHCGGRLAGASPSVGVDHDSRVHWRADRGEVAVLRGGVRLHGRDHVGHGDAGADRRVCDGAAAQGRDLRRDRGDGARDAGQRAARRRAGARRGRGGHRRRRPQHVQHLDGRGARRGGVRREGRQARQPGGVELGGRGGRAGGVRRQDRADAGGRRAVRGRGGDGLHVRAGLPPGHAARGRPPDASLAFARCSTSWGRSPTRPSPAAWSWASPTRPSASGWRRPLRS